MPQGCAAGSVSASSPAATSPAGHPCSVHPGLGSSASPCQPPSSGVRSPGHKRPLFRLRAEEAKMGWSAEPWVWWVGRNCLEVRLWGRAPREQVWRRGGEREKAVGLQWGCQNRRGHCSPERCPQSKSLAFSVKWPESPSPGQARRGCSRALQTRARVAGLCSFRVQSAAPAERGQRVSLVRGHTGAAGIVCGQGSQALLSDRIRAPNGCHLPSPFLGVSWGDSICMLVLTLKYPGKGRG